jgi:hypothetical protein
MQPLFRRLGLAGDEIEQSRIAAAQVFVRSSQIDIQRSDRSERSQRDDREWGAGRDRLDRNRSVYSLQRQPGCVRDILGAMCRAELRIALRHLAESPGDPKGRELAGTERLFLRALEQGKIDPPGEGYCGPVDPLMRSVSTFRGS